MNNLPKEYLAHRQFCINRIERTLDSIENEDLHHSEHLNKIKYQAIRMLARCITVENIQPIYSAIGDIIRKEYNNNALPNAEQGRELYRQLKSKINNETLEFHQLVFLVKRYCFEVENQTYTEDEIDNIILEELFGKEDE